MEESDKTLILTPSIHNMLALISSDIKTVTEWITLYL
jgi:hypothetical protein